MQGVNPNERHIWPSAPKKKDGRIPKAKTGGNARPAQTIETTSFSMGGSRQAGGCSPMTGGASMADVSPG
jgi:hypothetical protein